MNIDLVSGVQLCSIVLSRESGDDLYGGEVWVAVRKSHHDCTTNDCSPTMNRLEDLNAIATSEPQGMCEVPILTKASHQDDFAHGIISGLDLTSDKADHFLDNWVNDLVYSAQGHMPFALSNPETGVISKPWYWNAETFSMGIRPKRHVLRFDHCIKVVDGLADDISIVALFVLQDGSHVFFEGCVEKGAAAEAT